MGSKDVSGPAKTVSATLTYEQKDLYNYFSKWFSERHYDVTESDIMEKLTGDGKRKYGFSWEAEKKVDDYTKLIIGVDFEAEVENVKIEMHDGKQKTAQKGTVTVEFQGYVKRDYKDEWTLSKSRPSRHLAREVYDQFIAKGKGERHEAQLSKDMKAVIADLKTYLKMHRYD